MYTNILDALGDDAVAQNEVKDGASLVGKLEILRKSLELVDRLVLLKDYAAALSVTMFDGFLVYCQKLYVARIAFCLGLIMDFSDMAFKSLSSPYKDLDHYLKVVNPYYYKKPAVSIQRPSNKEVLAELQKNPTFLEDVEEEQIPSDLEINAGLGRNVFRTDRGKKRSPTWEVNVLKTDVSFKIKPKSKDSFTASNAKDVNEYIDM